MVKIRVFVPHLDLKETFEDVAKSLPEYNNVKIEMTYVFGTPNILSENWDAEILVARGMTHDVLKDYFPKKHIINIELNSFDILNALFECKSLNAKKIALCVHNVDIQSIPLLETICGAKIERFDVIDERTAENVVDSGLRAGCDIFVGAGTVCGICDRLSVKRVHIKTKRDAVLMAMEDALYAAKTINQERTRSKIINTMLNNSAEGIIAIDNKGEILEINNQAYRILQLSTIGELKGRLVTSIVSSEDWLSFINTKSDSDKILSILGKNYYVQYKSLDIKENETGAIVFIKNTDKIIEEEINIRRNLFKKGLTAKYTFDDILGKSSKIVENKTMAERFSRVNSNVLIIGETGTGKELFAHSIHLSSNRSKEPFVALNCAALPENLLESELFGYEEGAFSGASKGGKVGLFELAHKGTIFLDEIGEIPITLQAKLLRVLQEKEIRRIGSTTVQPIDVRVISATNINIEKKIKEGEFRQDLYYRLNLLDIIIPPLRERKEDIQEIIDAYLTKFACEMGKAIPSVTKEAAEVLKQHDWPGNVRELRNICERLTVLNETKVVDMNLLKTIKFVPKGALSEEELVVKDYELDSIYGKIEPKIKKKYLAEQLGVSRTTLWRMAKKQKELEKNN